MWLFTSFGFYSVVQKPGAADLTVRARARRDLDHLRDRYLPTLKPTVAGAGTDYRYRATVPREDLALAMGAIVRDIDYGNFKNEVRREVGPAREALCHRVWDVMFDLEQIDEGKAS